MGFSFQNTKEIQAIWFHGEIYKNRIHEISVCRLTNVNISFGKNHFVALLTFATTLSQTFLTYVHTCSYRRNTDYSTPSLQFFFSTCIHTYILPQSIHRYLQMHTIKSKYSWRQAGLRIIFFDKMTFSTVLSKASVFSIVIFHTHIRVVVEWYINRYTHYIDTYLQKYLLSMSMFACVKVFCEQNVHSIVLFLCCTSFFVRSL